MEWFESMEEEEYDEATPRKTLKQVKKQIRRNMLKHSPEKVKEQLFGKRQAKKIESSMKKALRQQADNDDSDDVNEEYDEKDSMADFFISVFFWRFEVNMERSDYLRVFFDAFECVAPAINSVQWTDMLQWNQSFKSRFNTITYGTYNYSADQDLYDLIEFGLHSFDFLVIAAYAGMGYMGLEETTIHLSKYLDTFFRAFVAMYF